MQVEGRDPTDVHILISDGRDPLRRHQLLRPHSRLHQLRLRAVELCAWTALLLLLSIPSTAQAQINYADLHCDKLMALWKSPTSNITTAQGQIHLEALQAGKCAAQLFAVYVPPQEADPVTVGQAQLNAFRQRVVDASGGAIRQARDLVSLLANLRVGAISAILAMEGADAIGSTASGLATWAEAGVRVISLTWNNSNAFADGPDEGESAPRGGLTTEGHKLLTAMEKHRIAPDLSHAHYDTFWDTVTTVTGPVLATHSNSRAIRDLKRNLDDEQIVAIAQKSGLIGLCFHSGHISNRKHATVPEFAAHLRHIITIAGPRTVALGSDFDGMIRSIQGIRNPGDVPSLRRQLADEGFPTQMLDGLFLGNFLRFFFALDYLHSTISPLGWRPMDVIPITPSDDTEPLYDRLSTTIYRLCPGDGPPPHPRGAPPPYRLGFRAMGRNLYQVAVRLTSPNQRLETVKVSARIAAYGGAAETSRVCPTDGTRCLVPVPAGLSLDTDSVPVTLVFFLENDADDACVYVHDVVPLRKVTGVE